MKNLTEARKDPHQIQIEMEDLMRRALYIVMFAKIVNSYKQNTFVRMSLTVKGDGLWENIGTLLGVHANAA